MSSSPDVWDPSLIPTIYRLSNDVWHEICDYLTSESVVELFNVRSRFLMQRLCSAGVVTHFTIIPIMLAVDYGWKFVWKCLKRVRSLTIERFNATRFAFVALKNMASSSVRTLCIKIDSWDSSSLQNVSLAVIFPSLKRLRWTFGKITGDINPSSAIGFSLKHLPQGLETLDLGIGTVPHALLSSSLPKSLTEFTASVEVKSASESARLATSIAAQCPNMTNLSLSTFWEPLAHPAPNIHRFQKLFPNLSSLMLNGVHWPLDELQGDPIQTGNLQELTLGGRRFSLPSEAIALLPCSLTSLSFASLESVWTGSDVTDLKWFQQLPRKLTFLLMPHHLIDWKRLPPALTHLVATYEAGGVAYVDYLRRHSERVAVGFEFELPPTLTILESYLALVRPTSQDIAQFPKRLTSLSMPVFGRWTNLEVAALFATLPLLSALTLRGEITVITPPKPGSKIFNLEEHPRRSVFNDELERNKTLKVDAWSISPAAFQIPSSITAVNLTPSNTTSTHKEFLSSANIDWTAQPPNVTSILALVPHLQRLELKWTCFPGAEVSIHRHIRPLKQLTHLSLLGERPEHCCFSDLPRSLLTLKLSLASIWWHAYSEPVKYLPPGLTDLRLLGAVFQSDSIPNWPVTLTRLDVETKRWKVEDAMELRKRLAKVERIVLRGEPLLFTGKSLCPKVSGYPKLCPTNLDLDCIVRYTKASLEKIEFTSGLAFHAGPLCLPDHVRGLKLSYLESMEMSMHSLYPCHELGGLAGATLDHLSELTIVSRGTTWPTFLGMELILPSLTSLTLQLPHPPRSTLDLSSFNKLPKGLLHLSMIIMEIGAHYIVPGGVNHLEIHGQFSDFSCLPPSLRTLHAPQLILDTCGLESLKTTLTKLEFAGGRDWTERWVSKLMCMLRAQPKCQSRTSDMERQFEHLSLESATLCGAFFPSNATKFDRKLMKCSAESALGPQVNVKCWYFSFWIPLLPPSVVEIDYLIGAEPSLTSCEKEAKSAAPKHTESGLSSHIPRHSSIAAFAPFPPTLTTLKLSIERLNFSDISRLPPSLTHLSVSYNLIVTDFSDWKFLPRKLKVLKMWNRNPALQSISEDAGVGLPPELQVCYLPDFLFLPVAMLYLSQSLTYLCVQEGKLFERIADRMPWVHVVAAPPRT